MTCIYCGEIYSPQAIKELKQMGENFYLGDDGFVCPVCLETINKKPTKEQVRELLGIGGKHAGA